MHMAVIVILLLSTLSGMTCQWMFLPKRNYKYGKLFGRVFIVFNSDGLRPIPRDTYDRGLASMFDDTKWIQRKSLHTSQVAH